MTTTDLSTGLADVKAKTVDAVRAAAARQAVLDAHLAICILKTTL